MSRRAHPHHLLTLLIVIVSACGHGPRRPLAVDSGAACEELSLAWSLDFARRRQTLMQAFGQINRALAQVDVAGSGSQRNELNFQEQAEWARLQLSELNRWSDSFGYRGDTVSPAIVSLVRFHAATGRGDLKIMVSALNDAEKRLAHASRLLCEKK